MRGERGEKMGEEGEIGAGGAGEEKVVELKVLLRNEGWSIV